ncbi:uncharacterized protein LOC130636036 isoform X4 [Hydractinia symbiolongicarpus]|uniref:uncharacterized protein LOC130636036 isoform X4 n=1 Tax=Hydractinia symbiolongicarpus TaxID=13093 RepID=UPI0025515B4B|nr:uncharacterized protein LOC130636036 isoform X4 [Hydractinia symbiolongicarpus]
MQVKCTVLKSLLELNDGHSESLSDITQVVNELMPGHSAAAVHKCLVATFPDLQAQQSNNKEEIYYLGLRFIPNVPSEEKIMLWLRKRFKEDKFGSVSCRTLFDIASKELGHVKQNSIGGHVRRAFPNVYTRRSDRLRWYCGISLPEKEVTTAENSRKIWLENACEWLRSNIQEKDAAKEKCSMVYAALHQYVGKVSIENCMAAIKCVFPRVVRKTFDRNAFYVGLQFIHDSVRNNVKFTPVKVRGTALPKPVINEEEQELVYWLQSILYKNDCHREKLIDLKNVLCKKIGKVITEKAALQLVRKAFPDIFYRKRDGLATVKGVEIMPQYKPRDQWLEKATAWVKKILTAKSTEHCERFSTITDILKQGLGSVTYAKIYQILELAFPSIVMKNEVEGKYIYGVGLADNYLDVTYPVFNIEDRQGDFSDVVIEQTFKLSKIASFTDHSTMEDSMCQTPVTPASNDEIKRMEEKLDGLMSVIDQLKNDINSLKEELAQSSRQKDSLIIQLQQTLVLLTQQQYQRMLKPNHACVNGGEIASRNSLSGGEITSGNSLNLPRLASLQNSVHSEKEPGFSKQ